MVGRTGVQIVGREAESRLLHDALMLAGQGQPQVVLVAGDAGIGKTTLVAEVEQRATELGYAIVRGQCLDIQAGIPLAPAVAAVRVLLASVDDAEDRPHARRMQQLLDPATPQVEDVRLLDDLRLALLEAAAAGPILLVFEDLHWADSSTRDLITTLASTASGRLLLVLTFRSDELHRRHPLRAALAELRRSGSVRAVDLGPLSRQDVARLMAGRSGSVPRTTGALVDAPALGGKPPLRRGASRGRAVLGHLAHARASGRSPSRPCRPARGRHSAAPTGRLDRRHQPGHRGADPGHRLQARGRRGKPAGGGRGVCAAPTSRPPRVPARFDPGGRVRRSPPRRADAHARVGGPGPVGAGRGGQGSLLARPEPRCLSLARGARHTARPGRVDTGGQRRDTTRCSRGRPSPRVRAFSLGPGPRRPGTHRPRSSRASADARPGPLEGQDDIPGWHARVHEAVRLIGPDTDPLLASRIYGALGRCWLFPDDSVGRAEAVQLSLELAGTQPSEELARALDAKAHFLNQYDHFVESLEWAGRAIEVSRTVDCPEVLITSLSVSALNHFMLGDLKEAIRLQTEACLVGREAGLHGEALWDGMVLADQLALSGDVEQGVATAEELLREARSLGLSERGAQGGVVLLQARIRQGRFDESEALLDELVAMGIDSQYAKWFRAPLLLARGRRRGSQALRPERHGVRGRAPGDAERRRHRDAYVAVLHARRLAAGNPDRGVLPRTSSRIPTHRCATRLRRTAAIARCASRRAPAWRVRDRSSQWRAAR